jgi:hypothetical protein
MSNNEEEEKAENGDNSTPKKRLSLKDRKAKLEEKHKSDMAKLKIKIRAEEAKEARKARKLDDHYKIIEGALSRKHRLANPNCEQAKQMNRLFDEYVIKDDARIFFGFEVLPEKEKAKRIEQHKAERKKQKDIESF